METDKFDVRAAQACELEEALHPFQEPTWTILVHDARGQQVVAPVLRVGQLRAMGITLWLGLESARTPVPDATVVYVVAATAETIRRIVLDLQHVSCCCYCCRCYSQSLGDVWQHVY
jgi:hypothetical protein